MKRLLGVVGLGAGALSLWIGQAQERRPELKIAHTESIAFGPERDRFLGAQDARQRFRLSRATGEVTAMVGTASASGDPASAIAIPSVRSEEHTSELQSR